MSISSIVTEGYGPGASIALVVTSGYAVGEAVQPPVQVNFGSGGGGGGRVSHGRRTSPRPKSPGTRWINTEKELVDAKRRREEEAWREAAERTLSEARLAQIEAEQEAERERARLARQNVFVPIPFDEPGPLPVPDKKPDISVPIPVAKPLAPPAEILVVKPDKKPVIVELPTTPRPVAVAPAVAQPDMRAEMEAMRREMDALRAEIKRMKRNQRALEALFLVAA